MIFTKKSMKMERVAIRSHLPIIALALLVISYCLPTQAQEQEVIEPLETLAVAPQLNSLLEQLALMIEQKKYQEAYQLALGQVFNFEGHAQFDFYYGLSASRLKKFDEAQMVFERLLNDHPDQQRYRLELARCYYYSNNIAKSKKAFDKVLASNPPYDVQVNIRQFLQLIKQKQRNISPHLLAGADLQTGYDSNINSATSANALDFSLPLQTSQGPITLDGQIKLSDSQRATGSSFLNSQGYVSWQHPFSQRTAMDVLLLASHRLNTESSDFDVTAAMLDSGYQLLRGSHLFRMGASYSHYWLNSEKLQHQYGVSGQWQMLLDKQWSLTSRLTLSRLNNEKNDALNMNQKQLSTALNRRGKLWSHTVGAVISTDSSLKSVNRYQGKKALAINYQVQYTIDSQWKALAGTSWRRSRYDDDFPTSDIFNSGEQRVENQLNFNLGASFAINKQLTSKFDVNHSQNNSNLKSYQYSRTMAQLGISWLYN